MRIRPHHALCAQFFVGKGYSEQFVEHMCRVLAELGRNGALVTLTVECDDIGKKSRRIKTVGMWVPDRLTRFQ